MQQNYEIGYALSTLIATFIVSLNLDQKIITEFKSGVCVIISNNFNAKYPSFLQGTIAYDLAFKLPASFFDSYFVKICSVQTMVSLELRTESVTLKRNKNRKISHVIHVLINESSIKYMKSFDLNPFLTRWDLRYENTDATNNIRTDFLSINDTKTKEQEKSLSQICIESDLMDVSISIYRSMVKNNHILNNDDDICFNITKDFINIDNAVLFPHVLPLPTKMTHGKLIYERSIAPTSIPYPITSLPTAEKEIKVWTSSNPTSYFLYIFAILRISNCNPEVFLEISPSIRQKGYMLLSMSEDIRHDFLSLLLNVYNHSILEYLGGSTSSKSKSFIDMSDHPSASPSSFNGADMKFRRITAEICRILIFSLSPLLETKEEKKRIKGHAFMFYFGANVSIIHCFTIILYIFQIERCQ